MSGGVWIRLPVESLRSPEEKVFHSDFVANLTRRVIVQRRSSFACFVAIRERPECSRPLSFDHRQRPRYLKWHGWVPALSGTDVGSPGHRLKSGLGAPSDGHKVCVIAHDPWFMGRSLTTLEQLLPTWCSLGRVT